ncbi:MAG: NYN domain-containing protein [Acutalibacteraceae bacterium]
MIRTAILIDGAFYLKRAAFLWGNKTPEDRADELIAYCKRHLQCANNNTESKYLYRIFYYDCLPSDKKVYHPLTQKTVDLKKTDLYTWSNKFFDELKSKRKVAIRKGELLDSNIGYTLKKDTIKKLCNKKISIDDLTEDDFHLDIQQKGVDMKIGLDI